MQGNRSLVSRRWSWKALQRVTTVVCFIVATALISGPASAVIEGDGFAVAVPASVFKFVVDVPDDGSDKAGGWQIAKAVVPIHDSRKMDPMGMWSCNVKVGMPLRTTKDGKISASKAATLSAEVAEKAWADLLPRRPPGEWTSGTFCALYPAEMQKVFDKPQYRTIGASVGKWQ